MMPPQRAQDNTGNLSRMIRTKTASGRRSISIPDLLDASPRRPEDHGIDIKNSGALLARAQSNPSERILQEENEKAREGIKRAVEELLEFDQKQLLAVKRQKLAIQNSYFKVPSLSAEREENNKGNETYDVGSEIRMPMMDEPGQAESKGGTDKEGVKKGRDEGKDGKGEYTERLRPPPPSPTVNSSYLPLPWRGRLGYACLNTYLRTADPPVFCSRTCRIASVIEHSYPLRDPSQPEHPAKNRPDRAQPADPTLGTKYVQGLGLQNAKDIVKMLRWNEKYGIKFLRLPSDMFPFASHSEYGYSLDFASEVLADAGRVAAELGHRLTAHLGQRTQLGSPSREVIAASVRDLEYHDSMLSLLALPEQQDRDAVMVLHLGGVFGSKAATLDRFRANYRALAPGIKRRLVLENDDVSWSVQDLLPLCEELDIPLVLDWHHHNVMHEATQVQKETKDIEPLIPRILATWRRKGITPKMHYSEPCVGAVTVKEKRRHSPRVRTLPPCPDNMDLMIEAKDKEQAVLELMRIFRLPGWKRFNEMVPYKREDQEDKGKGKKKFGGTKEDEDGKCEGFMDTSAEFAMGGPHGKVYYPEGMEEWLKPKRRPRGERT